jgi:hypothetical protein
MSDGIKKNGPITFNPSTLAIPDYTAGKQGISYIPHNIGYRQISYLRH